MSTHREAGFTLVDTMIAVTIVAVLATLAIPFYRDYVVRTQVIEGLTLAAGSADAVAQTYMEDGVWPADNSAAGLGAPDGYQGLYVTSIEVVDGSVRITYGGLANAVIRGRTLTIEPAVDGAGDIRWQCGAAESPARQIARAMNGGDEEDGSTETVDAKYVPDGCRP